MLTSDEEIKDEAEHEESGPPLLLKRRASPPLLLQKLPLSVALPQRRAGASPIRIFGRPAAVSTDDGRVRFAGAVFPEYVNNAGRRITVDGPLVSVLDFSQSRSNFPPDGPGFSDVTSLNPSPQRTKPPVCSRLPDAHRTRSKPSAVADHCHGSHGAIAGEVCLPVPAIRVRHFPSLAPKISRLPNPS